MRSDYKLLEVPKAAMDKNAPLKERHRALLDTHDDADLLVIFHDDLRSGSKINMDLYRQALERNMAVVLVTHLHGTQELI